MKNKIETKISNIYYNKNDKDINKTIKQINRAYKFNKKIYNKEINKFKTVIVYSRKEYDKYHSTKKSKKWHVGSTRKDKRLLILSPAQIEKYSIYKKELFPWILKHEINHLFYYNIYKTNKPWWINEGLSLLVDNKYKPKNNKELIKQISQKKEKLLIYTQNKKNRNFIFKNVNLIYPLAYLMVKKLKQRYGTNKINKFLTEYSKNPTKKIFNNIFKKTFKKTQNQILKEIIKENDK